MQAHELDQDKFDYEMQVVSVKLNIRELRRAFQQASLSPELLNICDSVDPFSDVDVDVKQFSRR